MTGNQKNNYLEKAFDSFCKTVIRNAAINAHKEVSARAEKEIQLSALSQDILSELSCEDSYNIYQRTYYVQGRPVQIHDPDLGDVMQYLSPQRRDVILLCYFLDFSDTDIARLLKISNPAVHKRKSAALKRLRELLEEIENG
jgi:RNA polymerase sigma factor (sigma-70 family)